MDVLNHLKSIYQSTPLSLTNAIGLDSITLGDIKYNIDTYTSFLRKNNTNNKEYYKLSTIIIYINTSKLGGNFYGPYIVLQKKNGLQYIEVTDRKNLMDFLNGVLTIEKVSQIDQTAYFNTNYIQDNNNVPMQVEENLDTYISNEIHLSTNETILTCKKDFTYLISKLDRIMKPKENITNISKTDKKTKLTPIIVVPSALTSLLTLSNAQDFLEYGNFNLSQSFPTQSVTVTRGSAFDENVSVRYKLIESNVVPSLTDEQWESIVAVFVTGQSWQFKDWKLKPPELFEKVCGFHLHWDDELLNENVKKWRIHPLVVSKTKRYLDKSTCFEYWRLLIDNLKSKNKKNVNF